MENSNTLNQRRFDSLGSQLKAIEDQAEKTGDQERIDQVNSIRSAISAVGLSANNISHIHDGDSEMGNGKRTIAAYKPGSDEFLSVGADRLIEGSEAANMSVESYTRAVLNHEKTHQASRMAEGVGETDAVFIELFGEKAIHNTEEAAASQADGAAHTAKFDAYDAERAAVRSYASKLGISNSEILRIRRKGDSDALKEHAENAGLLDEQNGLAA